MTTTSGRCRRDFARIRTSTAAALAAELAHLASAADLHIVLFLGGLRPRHCRYRLKNCVFQGHLARGAKNRLISAGSEVREFLEKLSDGRAKFRLFRLSG